MPPMPVSYTHLVASLPKELIEEENIEVVSLFLNEDGQEHVDATMDPVSYTHLDVYKRQVRAWFAGLASPPSRALPLPSL